MLDRHRQWIRASLKEKCLASEDEYEVLRDARGNEGGPRRGRLNKGSKIFSSWHLLFYGKFDNANTLEMHAQFARIDGAVVTRVETSDDAPSVSFGSTTVVVVDETPEKAASKARYVGDILPFGRRVAPTRALTAMRSPSVSVDERRSISVHRRSTNSICVSISKTTIDEAI